MVQTAYDLDNDSVASNKKLIAELRKTNITDNLPVTSRIVRLRKQQELMRVLVNHYIFHNLMREKLTEELAGFLEYTEQLYMQPNSVLDVIRQEHLLDSLPYLLSVMRYEINAMKGKIDT